MSTAAAAQTSPKGKAKLTEEEKADRKRKREEEVAERARVKAQKKEMSLDPVPQVKTINVSGQTIFSCIYTGIPTDVVYSIPSNGRFKGSFLNPAVAIRWLEENQDTAKFAKYRDLIVKDVQDHDVTFKEAPSNLVLSIFGGDLSIDEYKATCRHQEYISKSGDWDCFRTVDEYLKEKEDNKKSKSKSDSKNTKKPKLFSLSATEGSATGKIESFDCKKHDAPLLAVAVPPSEAYKRISKRLGIPADTPMSEIPLLSVLEENPNANLLIVTDPDDNKEDVKSFEKYLADLAKKQ